MQSPRLCLCILDSSNSALVSLSDSLVSPLGLLSESLEMLVSGVLLNSQGYSWEWYVCLLVPHHLSRISCPRDVGAITADQPKDDAAPLSFSLGLLSLTLCFRFLFSFSPKSWDCMVSLSL